MISRSFAIISISVALGATSAGEKVPEGVY